MLDTRAIERSTGWVVHHHGVVESTNDEAARLRDAGVGARVAVVADRQLQGRGRGGRLFASPEGGLYVSLLVLTAAEDLPGPLTAAVGLAAAEAAAEVADVQVGLKWPNDLWVGRKKLAGILIEAARPDAPVVVGLGMNLAVVPEDLPAAIRRETTALALEAGRDVSREALLAALLPRVDLRVADLRVARRRTALEGLWADRLVLRGERVVYYLASRLCRGVFLGATLAGGLQIEDDEDGRVARRGALVRDLRPEP